MSDGCDDKVTHIALYQDDARLWSVEDMLNDSLKQVRDGQRPGNKAVVLFLDDSDGVYRVGWCQAGMKCSEMIALAESFKARVIRDQMTE